MWTTPRTWVTGEVLTSTLLNTHVRDNLNFLFTGAPEVTNAQVGSYALVLADQGGVVEILNAGATTLTVPTNAAVAFPVGASVTIIQTGAGQITVAGAGGVTVNANPGLKLAGQWAMATLLKRATDTWILAGNISS